MKKPPTVRKAKLIYELKRYKRAVATRDIVINGLIDEMAGQHQIHDILAAYIAILAGDKERVIDKEDISNALGKYLVSFNVSEDGKSYVIKAVPAVKEDKHE